MSGKKALVISAACVAAIAIYASYCISNVYVIDGFEQPLLYKVSYGSFKFVKAISQMLVKLGLGTEYSVLRNQVHYLSFSKMPTDADLTIRDTKANGVPIRIYSPLIIEVGEKLPVLIYIHGGAYVYGNLDMFDFFLYKIAKRIKSVIISIDYRKAPEFAYPIPTGDCWSAIQFVLEHADELNIDLSKLMMAGDSAGGNAATVLTHRLIKENKPVPKLQVLVYPWVQLVNAKLPSHNEYRTNSILPIQKYILWYMGFKNVTAEMEDAIQSNSHILLIEDEGRREHIKALLHPDLIPVEYKQEYGYYTNQPENVYPSQLESNHILVRDKEFARTILQVFNEDVSPALLSDVQLKRMPATYILACEWDALKDEALIYAERLRRAGVKVEIDFYKTGLHGIAPFFEYALSERMSQSIISYIERNLQM